MKRCGRVKKFFCVPVRRSQKKRCRRPLVRFSDPVMNRHKAQSHAMHQRACAWDVYVPISAAGAKHYYSLYVFAGWGPQGWNFIVVSKLANAESTTVMEVLVLHRLRLTCNQLWARHGMAFGRFGWGQGSKPLDAFSFIALISARSLVYKYCTWSNVQTKKKEDESAPAIFLKLRYTIFSIHLCPDIFLPLL